MNPRRNLTVAGVVAATAILAACSGTLTPATSSGRAPSNCAVKRAAHRNDDRSDHGSARSQGD